MIKSLSKSKVTPLATNNTHCSFSLSHRIIYLIIKVFQMFLGGVVINTGLCSNLLSIL